MHITAPTTAHRLSLPGSGVQVAEGHVQVGCPAVLLCTLGLLLRPVP